MPLRIASLGDHRIRAVSPGPTSGNDQNQCPEWSRIDYGVSVVRFTRFSKRKRAVSVRT